MKVGNSLICKMDYVYNDVNILHSKGSRCYVYFDESLALFISNYKDYIDGKWFSLIKGERDYVYD